VFQSAIGRGQLTQSAIGRRQLTQSFQKLGHSRPVADSPQGFGRGSPVLKRGIVQEQDQSRDSLLVASQANGVDRDLADRFVRIEEARGDHDPRRRMIDARGRPDGVPARVHRAIRRDHLGQERNCAFVFPRQGLDGPMLNGRSRIVEQVHEGADAPPASDFGQLVRN